MTTPDDLVKLARECGATEPLTIKNVFLVDAAFLEAFASRIASQKALQTAPVQQAPSLDRGDAVNLARNMLTVHDCKGITSYGVCVLSEAVMAMDAFIASQAREPEWRGIDREAGLMLVRTERGLRVEKAITDAQAEAPKEGA